jgi:mono/diheme cytochrome c family protein
MRFAVGAATLLFVAVVFTVNASAASPDKVVRGKYLVDNIGMCQDCHTPRNERGEFIREKWLQGSELMFKPAVPVPGWTSKSPQISGLPNWTDEQARKFLMTGIMPDGSRANPPMPEFRYNRQDADAIIAYLRSLEKQEPGKKAGGARKQVGASQPLLGR